MADIVSFGEWVRRRRQALDLSRDALADQVGCSPVTIKKIERDERRPSRQIAELLAQQLELPESMRSQFIQMGRGQYVSAMPSPLDGIGRPPGMVRTVDRRQHQPKDLPEQTTSFIGREEELAEIGRLLGKESECRLLTLAGPGGVGKTRLAIQAATQLDDLFPDGVFFVALAPIDAAQFLVSTIIDAVGIAYHTSSDPKSQLLHYLSQQRLLLLMDNFEQLLVPPSSQQAPVAVDILGDILANAPQVKLLVTSRERLNLQQEWVFNVSGLDIPYELALKEPEAYSSLALFQERARRAKHDFAITPADLPHVVRLCHLLDGMPLGLELAAGWIRLLAPQEIADQIESSLDFLETSMRDRPERHRSLRAVFDHSWQMLTAEEQTLLRSLSIFRDGFRLQAAAAVARATLPNLSALVDKSFLKRRQNGRYEIHELLRQYAAEKLELEAGDRAEVQLLHIAYYCDFLGEREKALKSATVMEALAEIAEEIENVRLSWDWAIRQEQVAHLEKAAESLSWFYFWRARHREAVVLLSRACQMMEARVASTVPAPAGELCLLAALLVCQARSAYELGQRRRAADLCQSAIAHLDAAERAGADTHAQRAPALEVLAIANNDIVDKLSATISLLEQSLTYNQTVGDRFGIGRVLYYLGDMRVTWSDYDGAEQRLLAAWETDAGLDHPLASIWTRVQLGTAIVRQGRVQEGEQWICQGLELSAKLDYQRGLLRAVRLLGDAHVHGGRFAEVLSLLADDASHEAGLDVGILLGWGILIRCQALLHLGRYQECRDQLRAVPAAPWSEGYRQFLAGCIQMAWGAHDQAVQSLRQSAESLREGYWYFDLCLTLATWSQLASTLGDETTARHHLLEALHLGLDMPAYLPLLAAISAGAILKTAEGESEQAVELYALALAHPFVANSRWYADVVTPQIEAAAEALPEEVVAAARERGRTRDLWSSSEALLAELQV